MNHETGPRYKPRMLKCGVCLTRFSASRCTAYLCSAKCRKIVSRWLKDGSPSPSPIIYYDRNCGRACYGLGY